MGFKIVLLGSDSELMGQVMNRIDDLPWVPSRVGHDFSAESVESIELFFDRKSPSVIVSIGPFIDVEEADFCAYLTNLVTVCEKRDIPLIQLSSYPADYTQGEVAEEPLDIDSSTGLLVEPIVSILPRHIILRRSWLLDGGRLSLLDKFVPSLLNGEPIAVSDHDFGCPVSTSYMADAVIAIIQQILTGADNWGVFHLRSADTCSEAEFCDHLVRQLRKETELGIAVPTVSPKGDTRRYLSGNAQLLGRRVTDSFGIQQPTWRRGFGKMLREWFEKNMKDQ